jgi:hypothetical protein
VFQYKAYGLALNSDQPISGLMPVSSDHPSHDVQIRLGSLPPGISMPVSRKLRYASTFLTEAGQPTLQIWDVQDGEFLSVHYCDEAEFWLDRGCRTMWAHWPASSSLENTLSYLLGPVLGLLLRLRGVVCLHGSAVSINDRGVVFVGSEGAGKSTTAAAFATQGNPVLSDDIVALTERGAEFQILPAYPRINLWPDSVKLLFGSPDALPMITAGWDKRCLKIGEEKGTKFAERPLPFGAIYIFGDGEGGSRDNVESISQKTAMMTLVTNTYATSFLSAKQRAEEFEVLSRLVATVPVRKINVRHGTLLVDELCDVIRHDFSSLK